MPQYQNQKMLFSWSASPAYWTRLGKITSTKKPTNQIIRIITTNNWAWQALRLWPPTHWHYYRIRADAPRPELINWDASWVWNVGNDIKTSQSRPLTHTHTHTLTLTHTHTHTHTHIHTHSWGLKTWGEVGATHPLRLCPSWSKGPTYYQ